MITLITGLPGAGKTLFAISTIAERSAKDGRPVFYSGITMLKPPAGWTELEDPERYFDLPPNSIVLVDEAQRIWRPRAYGKAVPESVAKMETHRHGGIDLYLLTQHPGLIDSNVRKLTGSHFHVVRNFGLHRSTVHEWMECHDNVAKRTDSVRHEWRYPKKYFGVYKSAEVHTHQARVPARVWFLLAAPFIIGVLVYFTYQNFRAKIAAPDAQEVPRQDTGRYVKSSTQSKQVAAPERDYVTEYIPRLQDVPESAPAYDELTKPRSFPIVSACVQSRSKGCQCYSQQGTPLGVTEPRCRDFVKRGSFNQYREEQREPSPGRTPDTQPQAPTEAVSLSLQSNTGI